MAERDVDRRVAQRAENDPQTARGIAGRRAPEALMQESQHRGPQQRFEERTLVRSVVCNQPRVHGHLPFKRESSEWLPFRVPEGAVRVNDRVLSCRHRRGDSVRSLRRVTRHTRTRLVDGLPVSHTLQFNGGLAAIRTDIGIAVVRRDLIVCEQVVQRMAVHVELVTRNKVGNNVVATLGGRQEFKDVGRATARHGVMAGAAQEGVMARATPHDGRAGPTDEFGVRGTARQCHRAVNGRFLGDAVLMLYMEDTPGNRRTPDRTERGTPNMGETARNSRTAAHTRALNDSIAIDGNGVVTHAQADGVVARSAGLHDRAVAHQGNRVGAAAHRHLPRAANGDAVVAGAGNDGPVALDVDRVGTAANQHTAAAEDYGVVAIAGDNRAVTEHGYGMVAAAGETSGWQESTSLELHGPAAGDLLYVRQHSKPAQTAVSTCSIDETTVTVNEICMSPQQRKTRNGSLVDALPRRSLRQTAKIRTSNAG